MTRREDDFPEPVKRLLGDQVGWRCSKPDCRAPTKGPASDGSDVAYVGVASHIHSASPSGARYDNDQSSEERRSAENGIHLCQTHGKLVDDDEIHYTVSLLREWKARAIEAAREEIGKPGLDRPLLQLRVLDPIGGANDIGMTYQVRESEAAPPRQIRQTTRSRFYHLQVANAHRTAPAHNVQVFLLRIDKRESDGTFQPVWLADKARVLWRYELENPELPKARTLGSPEDLDLCYVVKDVLGQGPTLQLRPAFIPVNLGPQLRIMPKEPVMLYFNARSDEMDSEVYRVRLWWNGQWSDDDAEMARHFSIELLP